MSKKISTFIISTIILLVQFHINVEDFATSSCYFANSIIVIYICVPVIVLFYGSKWMHEFQTKYIHIYVRTYNIHPSIFHQDLISFF